MVSRLLNEKQVAVLPSAVRLSYCALFRHGDLHGRKTLFVRSKFSAGAGRPLLK